MYLTKVKGKQITSKYEIELIEAVFLFTGVLSQFKI